MADEIKNTEATETPSGNFIYTFIEEDIAEGGRFEGKKVHTRFPPEPNGYLHIGHAKAICIDFGTAEKFGGICNLRMDDTNPTKEDVEYVDAIKEDIKWLGFDWEDRFYFASEYFDQMYDYAVELIKKGLAYVCELTPEQMRENRGDTQTPAKSPYRDRPIEESLDLFARMKAGEFEDGKMTLRAKSTLRQATLICVTLLFTELTVLLTTAQATSGASTLCTILRTRLKMLSRVSLTAFAHLSLKLTVRFTIGLSIIFPFLTSLVRLSLPVLALTTQLCQSVNSVNLLKRIM